MFPFRGGGRAHDAKRGSTGRSAATGDHIVRVIFNRRLLDQVRDVVSFALSLHGPDAGHDGAADEGEHADDAGGLPDVHVKTGVTACEEGEGEGRDRDQGGDEEADA